MRRRHGAVLSLCGTEGEPQSSQRDTARQQRRANDFLRDSVDVHSRLFRWYRQFNAAIREIFALWRGYRSQKGLARHTPAGTSVADVRISCRSAVKSVIVFVLTVATGRELRPVASRLDTITTLSM
jgi:hypothetical protein